MLKFNPLPRLPLIVLLTTPTTLPWPRYKPPLPLLCTRLFHTSAAGLPCGPALSPHPVLPDNVQPIIWRAAFASIPSAWLPATTQLVSVPLPDTPVPLFLLIVQPLNVIVPPPMPVLPFWLTTHPDKVMVPPLMPLPLLPVTSPPTSVTGPPSLCKPIEFVHSVKLFSVTAAY